MIKLCNSNNSWLYVIYVFFLLSTVCLLVSFTSLKLSCSRIWHTAPPKQMDRVENFRIAGTGGVRNRVRSFFVWFLGLLDLLARSWRVPREHMIMFLGRASKGGDISRILWEFHVKRRRQARKRRRRSALMGVRKCRRSGNTGFYDSNIASVRWHLATCAFSRYS